MNIHPSDVEASGLRFAVVVVPVAFGVLTTNTVEQAFDRVGGDRGNKGSEFAMAAIEMARLRASLDADGEAGR